MYNQYHTNPEIDEFLDYAISYESDNCLLTWKFSLDSSGYPNITRDGKHRTVANYICEKIYGARQGVEAAHNCGIALCLNKRHLRWDTKEGNIADTLIHNTRSMGEKHYASKLTKEQVEEIRNLKGKMLQREIGKLYGINQQTVSKIHKLQNWRYTLFPKMHDLFA
jgi:hypothetical protein